MRLKGTLADIMLNAARQSDESDLMVYQEAAHSTAIFLSHETVQFDPVDNRLTQSFRVNLAQRPFLADYIVVEYLFGRQYLPKLIGAIKPRTSSKLILQPSGRI